MCHRCAYVQGPCLCVSQLAIIGTVYYAQRGWLERAGLGTIDLCDCPSIHPTYVECNVRQRVRNVRNGGEGDVEVRQQERWPWPYIRVSCCLLSHCVLPLTYDLSSRKTTALVRGFGVALMLDRSGYHSISSTLCNPSLSPGQKWAFLVPKHLLGFKDRLCSYVDFTGVTNACPSAF